MGDNGVYMDRLADIVADCYAPDLEKDPAGTFERVACGLQQLAANGRIVRYIGYKLRDGENSGSGVPLLFISNWDRHQQIARPNKPRFSRPTSDDLESACSLQQVAAISVPGTGEQGNRGTEEQGSRGAEQQAPFASPDGSASATATGSKPSDRGTRIAEDFAPTAEMIQWAKSERPDLDPTAETEHFVDFWLSKPGKDGRKVKWDLTWKNWIRNARSKGPVSQPGSSKTDEWLKYAE